MQFRLSKETAVAWIESTVKEIKKLLIQRDIPFEDSWTRDLSNDKLFVESVFYTHQIKFPWHEGDVLVGTLHVSDDEVIAGTAPLRYPSIETWNFPWDDGDITVFDSPEEFVFKLYNLYIKIVAAKTNA